MKSIDSGLYTLIVLANLVVASILYNYTYWSHFSVPIDGFFSLESIISSSYEAIYIAVVTCSFFSLMNYVQHLHYKLTLFRRKVKYFNVVLFVMSLFFLAFYLIVHSTYITDRVLFNILFLIMFLSSFLIYCPTIIFLHNKITRYLRYRLICTKQNSTVNYFIERHNEVIDRRLELVSKFNINNQGRLKSYLIMSIIITGFSCLSIASSRANAIIDGTDYLYIENFNKDKIKFLGKLSNKYVFLSPNNELIFKNDISKLLIKRFDWEGWKRKFESKKSH